MKKLEIYSEALLEALTELNNIQTNLTIKSIVFATKHSEQRRFREEFDVIMHDEMLDLLRLGLPDVINAVLQGYISVDKKYVKPNSDDYYEAPKTASFGLTNRKNDLNIIASFSRTSNTNELTIVIKTVMRKKNFKFKDVGFFKIVK